MKPMQLFENQMRKKTSLRGKNRNKNAVKDIENIPIRDYGLRVIPRRVTAFFLRSLCLRLSFAHL